MVLAIMLASCQNEEKLPILGARYYDENIGDTVYHTIPPFTLTAHTGEAFSSKQLQGKPYVADFFFTHCPTMCPVMTSAIKKVQDEFNSNEVNFVSISIDPKRDTVKHLQVYIEKNHINTQNWTILRGEKHELQPIGEEGFFTAFGEDEAAPGGHFHSSYLYLIDKNGHIRGLYDGMDNEQVNQLIEDLKMLLKE